MICSPTVYRSVWKATENRNILMLCDGKPQFCMKVSAGLSCYPDTSNWEPKTTCAAQPTCTLPSMSINLKSVCSQPLFRKYYLCIKKKSTFAFPEMFRSAMYVKRVDFYYSNSDKVKLSHIGK